jgi:hypothetical protein
VLPLRKLSTYTKLMPCELQNVVSFFDQDWGRIARAAAAEHASRSGARSPDRVRDRGYAGS